MLTGLIVLITMGLFAQKTLPPAVLSAIPSKYKITSQVFIKQGYLVRSEIDLSIPNKKSCNDGAIGEGAIEIIIMAYDENQQAYIDMMEKRLPFKSRLPTALSHKPDIDPNNQVFAKAYSETKVVNFESGSAAYYIETISCIMDQHASYDAVSLISLQGSTVESIEIRVGAAISAEEAISIVKELYKNLSSINYFAV
jgi:hypothetical protein